MADDSLIAALARAQAKFPPIAKNHTNPHFRSRYADLSDVLAAVRPCLNAEGIWLSQPVETDDDGRVRLYTRLEGHGEKREACLPLYLDNMTPQQLLSTLTYYRRGMLCALLGVAGEDDDDGNAAQTAPARRQAEGGGGVTATREATTPLPPEPVDLDRPLVSMSIPELRQAAVLLGHDFGKGGVTKAEMIRQLDPLVRAKDGAEPWDMRPANYDHEEPPDTGDTEHRPRASGSERGAVNSSLRAES